MNRKITVTMLVFTVGCGGSPFVAGETAALDGETPDPTVDAGGSAADAGETDAATDKGPQDGGSEASIPVAEAGVDGAIEGSDGGVDAGKDAGELVDAGPACLTKAPVTWTCASAATIIAPSEFCSDDFSAPYTIAAQAVPAACSSWCTYTCACLTANYTGTLRVLSCSVAANGGITLNVD